MSRKNSFTIWTIGHSTRSIEDFISLLKESKIRSLADVRMFPGSRRYPHYNADSLAKSLSSVDVQYEHFPELGGRRKPRSDSPDIAWRNEAFRGYVDYMGTAGFASGMERLRELGRQKPAAIMCAEAVWWQCHRSLIADYLKANSIRVVHILDHGKTQEHPFTSPARIVDGKLSYSLQSDSELPL